MSAAETHDAVHATVPETQQHRQVSLLVKWNMNYIDTNLLIDPLLSYNHTVCIIFSLLLFSLY